MAETVLVTGGTGYVGGWSIVELLKRGYNVHTTIRSLGREASVRAAVATATDPGDQLKIFAADLTSDEGWSAAVKGCDYVWHVASPLGGRTQGNADALIVPAREGALRVLRAALEAGAKRIVMTSSTAASSPGPTGTDSTSDEAVWTDPKAKQLTPYRQSKVIAERAAWDFVAKQGASGTLTTVLPAGIFGPILTTEGLGSVQIIARLLSGSMPGTPRLGFCVVDVRDVVDAHLRAMTTPEAAGQRFIAANELMWLTDFAKVLKDGLGEKAAKVPTRNLPNFMVRIASIFDPALREITPGLGRRHMFSSDKAKRVLGWAPRPAKTAILDCANSLIATGVVKVP